MSSALKNRLVGTVIVVAIAVIFLPDLLDGKKETKRDLFVDLPDKPAMQKVEPPPEFDVERVKQASIRKVEVLSEQAVDDNLEQGQVVQDIALEDVPVIASSEAKQQNSLANQTVVESRDEQQPSSPGWVVQLGSFRHQKNVKELLSKLDKAGYRAFSRPVETNSGKLTKVFVGPDLAQQKLIDALPHLKELTQLQGRVTPFTVQ